MRLSRAAAAWLIAACWAGDLFAQGARAAPARPAPASPPQAHPAPAPAAQARPAPASPAQARPAPAAPAPAATRADTAHDTTRVEYRREVFSYRGGPRDPFRSLIQSSEVRPTLADLRLVSVLYDARGGNSVAIVREANNPRVHRLRRGSQIGRLRVVQIRQYEVVFQVEEFGFERQETLRLSRPEANP